MDKAVSVLYSPRMRKDKLRLKRALQAAVKMEVAIPAMVDELERLFYDNQVDQNGRFIVTPKEKIAIMRTFAKGALLTERNMKQLGLKSKDTHQGPNPVIAILGGDVTVFQNLPADERRAKVLEFLQDKQKPVPVEVKELPCESSDQGV